MKIKEWWEDLQYWKRGALIGFLVYSPFFISVFSTLNISTTLYLFSAMSLGIVAYAISSHFLEWLVNFNQTLNVRFKKVPNPKRWDTWLKAGIVWTVVSYILLILMGIPHGVSRSALGYFNPLILPAGFVMGLLVWVSEIFTIPESYMTFSLFLIYVVTIPLVISISILVFVRFIFINVKERWHR